MVHFVWYQNSLGWYQNSLVYQNSLDWLCLWSPGWASTRLAAITRRWKRRAWPPPTISWWKLELQLPSKIVQHKSFKLSAFKACHLGRHHISLAVTYCQTAPAHSPHDRHQQILTVSFSSQTGVKIISFKFLLSADKATEGRSMLMLFQGPRPRPGTILLFNKRWSICRQSRDVWCGWPPNAEMSEVSRSARHWMMSGAAPWKPMPIPDLSPA